jgi:hypothetical protein
LKTVFGRPESSITTCRSLRASEESNDEVLTPGDQAPAEIGESKRQDLRQWL